MIEIVKKYWEKVLTAKVDIKDDFFFLGGNSLLAIQIISEIQNHTGLELGLLDFFENPTVETLAARLELMRSEAENTENTTSKELLLKKEVKQWHDTTFWQQKIYLRHAFLKKQKLFNVTLEMTVNNDSIDLFQRAFSKIVQRHESLRTSFAIINGKVMQMVHELDYNSNFIHFSDLSEQEPTKQIITGIKDDHDWTPINLSTGPIYKATIYKFKKESLFLFTMHQINCDGHSLRVLRNELNFYLSNPGQEIEYPIQLKEIPELFLSGEKFEKSRQYWEKEFESDFDPSYMAYDLPVRIEKTPNISYADLLIKQSYLYCHEYLTNEEREISVGIVPTYRIERSTQVYFTLPESHFTSLVKKASHEKASTYYYVLASMAIVLYNMSGHLSNVIIASIGWYRNKKGLMNVIGYLSNFILYRLNVNSSMTINDLLDEVKKKVNHSHDHHVYPYEKILHHLDIPHEHLNHLLIDFVTLDAKMPLQPSSEYLFQERDEQADFDINCTILNYSNGMDFTVKYNQNLYYKETIVYFLNEFQEVLKKITSSGNVSLNDLVHDHFQTKKYV